MKAFIYTLFTAALLNTTMARACEYYPAEYQIDHQPSVERLLKKFSTRLKADCRIPLNEEETPDITVMYKDSDDDRTSGKILRSYKGRVECEKETGELVTGAIKGKVTIKIWRDEYDNDSCDGQILYSISKISSWIKI